MGYAGARAWETLGQGLTGLGSTIYGQRRQTDEDKRKTIEENQADADRKAMWALKLRDQQGGLGPVPTRSVDIPGTGAAPAAPTGNIFDTPPTLASGIGVHPGGTAGIGLTPPPPPKHISAPSITAPLQVQENDPRYEAVGDIGYVMTPEAQRTQEELRKADIGYGIGKAIGGAHPGMSAEAQTAAGMAVTQGAPWEAVTPKEFAPVRPTRGISVTGANGDVSIVDPTKLGPTGIKARVPPTPGETTPQQERAARIAAAKSLLDTRTKIESMTTTGGIPLDIDERARRITAALQDSGFKSYDEARQVARTEQVGRPMTDPMAPPARPAAAARPDVNQPGPGTQVPTAAGKTSAPTAVLDAAKQQYQGMPGAEQAMREDGWSQADIDYMIGGADGAR